MPLPDNVADALRSAIGTLKGRKDTAAKVVAQECREALGEPAKGSAERASLLEDLADGVEMALAALPDPSFASDDAERVTIQYLTDLSRRAKGLPPQYGVKRP